MKTVRYAGGWVLRSRLVDIDWLGGSPRGWPLVFSMPCETHWRCYRVRLPRSRAIVYLWQWLDE